MQVLHVVTVDLLCGVKARLGIVAIGQQKIGCVLVCRIEFCLSDWRKLRLARGRPEIRLNFLRMTWPCEQAPQAEQGGACDRISNAACGRWGEGNGKFAAYNSTTGKELWSFHAGAGVNGPPSSYTLGGKQYILVGAGGNVQVDFKRGNNIIAFTVD